MRLRALAASALLAAACTSPKVVHVVPTPEVTKAPKKKRPPPTAKPTPTPKPVAAKVVEPKKLPDVGGIEWPWIAIADCESGDGPKAAGPPYNPDWDYHGSDYDGGLNFAYSSWDRAWSLAVADGLVEGPSLDAWRHPARVQVLIAKDWLKRTDWGQWPTCSRVVGVR